MNFKQKKKKITGVKSIVFSKNKTKQNETHLKGRRNSVLTWEGTLYLWEREKSTQRASLLSVIFTHRNSTRKEVKSKV